MDAICSILFLISVIITSLICYGYHRRQYWARKKFPYLEPTNILLGSTGDIFLKKIPLSDYHAKMYEKLAPHKFGGYYNTFTPVLVLRDLEIIKNIFTKDFDYFMNRGQDPLDENDPLSQHLFNLKGETWRTLRAKLSPTFTSGKIKKMFNLMKECTDDYIELIDSSVKIDEPLEMKEMMARFTTDVISSCVFGLKSDSLKDPNSVFRAMGRKTFAPSTRRRIFGILAMIIPRFREIFKIPFFEKDIAEFFKSLVTNTIRNREENGIVRNDFLDLLIGLKKEEIISNKLINGECTQFEFTDNLLTAQCFVFFIAGFETSSNTMAFALYELAKRPDLQQKLFDEVNKIICENEGILNYECLQRMSYLDQVVCETLRMYPVLPSLVRISNVDYKIDDEHVIDKNTRVIIPVKGLHYDPLYYENPTEFNPENFSKEAKAKRPHFTYLPFGEGPRICIGMRFGLMQVKLGLATTIQNYAVSLSPNMKESLDFTLLSFTLTPKNGIWLKLKKRII